MVFVSFISPMRRSLCARFTMKLSALRWNDRNRAAGSSSTSSGATMVVLCGVALYARSTPGKLASHSLPVFATLPASPFFSDWMPLSITARSCLPALSLCAACAGRSSRVNSGPLSVLSV